VTVSIRTGSAEDRLECLRVLDGAVLAVETETLEGRLENGDLLLATDDSRVVGVLAIDPETDSQETVRVTNVAVRRARQNQGIGTALIEAAVARWGAVIAGFHRSKRPFYRSLGFEIECSEGRCEGRLRP